MTDHLAHLQVDADAVLGVLTRGPDAPVTTCPGWTVRDLVTHLGEVHRWATEIVRTREAQQGTPYDGDDLASWFADGASTLVQTLAATDPDAACWSFTTDRTAGFWRRRQALETVVHRWDAEGALGEPGAIDPALAGDGVTEVVELMAPRQVKLGRVEPIRAVVLRAVDTGREWQLGEGEPIGAVDASAQDLLLALWHRVDPGDPRLRISGDAEGVLRLPLTP